MQTRLLVAFLQRSKCLLISWLKSPSAVILGPQKIKSLTVSTFSPSICHEVMGLDAMILVFWILSFKPTFYSPLSLSSRGSLDFLHFLPWGWCHLCIWGYWYFSWQSLFQPVLHLAWHFTWCTLHELLIAKFRLKLKKAGKTTRPFRYDLNQILYDYTIEVRNRFKGLDLIVRVPDEL